MQMDLFSPSTIIRTAPPVPAAEARPASSDKIRMSLDDSAATLPSKRIVDTGERIAGARKDFHRHALSVDDLAGLSGAQKTELVIKDNVWPKPDYADRVQKGMNPEVAALIKILRDRLPISPRLVRNESFENLSTWYVAILTQMRMACEQATRVEDVAGIADLIKSTWSNNQTFAIYKTRYSPLPIFSADRQRAKTMVRDGFPADVEGWKRGCTVRGGGTEYAVYRARRRIGAFHKTEAEAWAAFKIYLDAERESRRKDGPEMPVHPHLTDLIRTGPETPKDVTAQHFIDTFGFRGVQFGKWLPNNERQIVLDAAFAGLNDLCFLIGIAPRHLALEGRLGIAFGARGRGGKAAAHYEPGERVLNMTKFTGAGRVAHEMGHAIDHWLGLIGHVDEVERGEARLATGHNHHGTDRRAALPRLNAELVEALIFTMQCITKATPTLYVCRDRAEGQIKSALDQIGIYERMNAKERSSARPSQANLRRNEQQIDVWKSVQAMATDDLRQIGLGAVPERLVNSQGTQFINQAKRIDPKTKAYWSTPCELFARAFEAWCHDRLEKLDRTSQYLVHSVEEGRYAPPLYKADIYPAGEERIRINAAFDDLIPLIAAEITRRAA